MRGTRTTTRLAAIALVAGCGGPEPGASSFALSSPAVGSVATSGGEASTTGQGSSEALPGDSASTGTTAVHSSTGASETTGTLRDVGSVDLGSSQPAGCKGKIDFLFIISRSGTMENLQERLVAAFPAFMETIETKFADFDYHIMAVDGDPFWGHPWCNEDCSPQECPVPDYPCEMVGALPACETTMGAGTVFPAGLDSPNKLCPISNGRRFIAQDQPNPVETFACTASVGGSGVGMLGEAAVAAVSPELNGPGGCNEGFLRGDALLMVTFIANNYDYLSAGKPKLWAEALLEAKHGDLNSVVMFSINDPECPPEDRICDLVKYYFPYWYIADNEEPDYGPAFEVATDLVVDACSSFIPQ